jgi:hypothetical protein
MDLQKLEHVFPAQAESQRHYCDGLSHWVPDKSFRGWRFFLISSWHARMSIIGLFGKITILFSLLPLDRNTLCINRCDSFFSTDGKCRTILAVRYIKINLYLQKAIVLKGFYDAISCQPFTDGLGPTTKTLPV